MSFDYLRGPPHPVIVTIGDNKDYIRVEYIRVLLYSYYTTITGWGVLLKFLGFYKVDMPYNVGHEPSPKGPRTQIIGL